MTMSNSTESASRIPVTLRRSGSLRQKGERCYYRSQPPANCQQQQQQQQLEPFPAITEHADSGPNVPLRRSSSSLSLSRGRTRRSQPEDTSDLESVRSFGSNCSNLSVASACEHAHFALNGTTWSARSRRYVVHRSPGSSSRGEREAADASPEHYLTPTQRAARQQRHLQALLKEARQQLDEREHEVARLTKELVELRLLKAGEEADEAPSVQQQQQQQAEQGGGGGGAATAATPSLVDSGLFEDAAAASHFERRIDEMQRRHQEELQLLKQAHHDRLEALLNQLADMSSRYCQAQPALERSKALELERDELRQQLQHSNELLADREERNKQAYLEVYAKGHQAARAEQQQLQLANDAQIVDSCPAKVSVAELLQQLTVTQAELDSVKPFQDSCYAPQHLALACRSHSLLSLQEAVSLWVLGTRKAMYRRILESRNKQNALDPEITLQFLKSAIYYFLTDKENLQGHLNAIESILGFSDSEKLNIDRIYRSAKK